MSNPCLTQELCPDSVALRSEFYNDWIAPQKQHDGLMGVIFREKTLTGMLGVVRRRGANPFTEKELSLTKSLMPHLQRAVQLHQRITNLETRSKATAEALNRSPVGVILLDASGRVLLMNRSAQAIVNEKVGLSMDAGGLRAARTNETIALRQLIQGAIESSSGNAVHSGGALALPRPSFRRDLNVLVAPVCANQTLFPETGASCVVFVTDGLMGVIFRERTLTGMLGVVRRRGANPFTEEELSLTQSLMPHLQACAHIGG